MPRIFVSHAVRDKKLVDSFVDLLQIGMNFDFNDIYCTSHGKIKTGEAFVEDILENLRSSDLFFFLISNQFLLSKFCLNEMGAAWALGKSFIPIIIPPTEFSKLEDTCLKGRQACRINVRNDMIQIYDALSNSNFVTNASYSRYELKLTEFLRKRPWEPGLGDIISPFLK